MSLTHLRAFMSDDAKRGRVWTSGVTDYKRDGGLLFSRLSQLKAACWQCNDVQVAAMTGVVHWADEPKTLTPQEALRALADGKCVSNGSNTWRLCTTREGGMMERIYQNMTWGPTTLGGYQGLVIVPDPLQPAEPTRPPLKVGDRVRFTLSDKKELYGSVKRNEDAGRVEVLWDGDYKPLTMTLTSAIERVDDPFVGEIRTSDIGGFLDALEKIGGFPTAEPAKPPLKVGDRVKRRWLGGKEVGRIIKVDYSEGDDAIQVQWNDGVGAYPNAADIILVEAEPQVDYPLTFGEAMVAIEAGNSVASNRYPLVVYSSIVPAEFGDRDVTDKWRIVEPATGGGE